jgi:hypothetical protein
MYLRHPNGRGKLFDESEVSIRSHLSRDSVAAGQCQIQDSRIQDGSVVAGSARIFGGKFIRTYIGGNIVIAGHPYAEHSILTGSNITGCPSLINAVVKDDAQVSDSAIIIGGGIDRPIIIEDSASIYGTAVLIGGFTVSGQARIESGTWTRAPHYINLGYASVTESKLGAMVECRNRTVDYWNRHGAKLGERMGYTADQIKKMIEAVNSLAGHALNYNEV